MIAAYLCLRGGGLHCIQDFLDAAEGEGQGVQ